MPTTEKINLLRRVATLDTSPAFNTYSKVVLHIDDNTIVEAGDDLGRTLEVDNPFGTQEIAEQMVSKLRGYQYQPYYAKGAFLDPAAEIGDGVSIKTFYGGIYQRNRIFGRLMAADIAAPNDEEINHEYKYESPSERKFNRQIGNVKASLLVQSGLIEAKVSKESPEGQTTFSWSMNNISHAWFANGKQVMKVSGDGLEVNGKVTATSGFIGSGAYGFAISASAICNGMTSLDDSSHNGIYIGTDGIALGKGAFKVTSSGGISANNMSLTGTLNIGGTAITAAALRSGAQSAYNNASTWSTGSGYGYSYNRATQNGTTSYPGYFRTATLRADQIYFGGFTLYVNSEGYVKAQGYA